MKHTITLWVIAFVLTTGSAAYQRLTGPTHPVSGTSQVRGRTISWTLERTHGGTGNHIVQIRTNDPEVGGILEWKRFKTNDGWTRLAMNYADSSLTAELPSQPPAGKLVYRIALMDNGQIVHIPPESDLIIRFKGDVPMSILILHIVLMFGGMLVSTRGGLEYLSSAPRYSPYVYWTIVLFFIGGLILGPIIQKFAFGEYWTGWPLGHDLTDNKTAIALVAWVVAAFRIRRSSRAGLWVVSAAIISIIAFMIPHSLLGSELDYNASAP